MRELRTAAMWRPARSHLSWARRLRSRPLDRREVGGGSPLRYRLVARRPLAISRSIAIHLAVQIRTRVNNLIGSFLIGGRPSPVVPSANQRSMASSVSRVGASGVIGAAGPYRFGASGSRRLDGRSSDPGHDSVAELTAKALAAAREQEGAPRTKEVRIANALRPGRRRREPPDPKRMRVREASGPRLRFDSGPLRSAVPTPFGTHGDRALKSPFQVTISRFVSTLRTLRGDFGQRSMRRHWIRATDRSRGLSSVSCLSSTHGQVLGVSASAGRPGSVAAHRRPLGQRTEARGEIRSRSSDAVKVLPLGVRSPGRATRHKAGSAVTPPPSIVVRKGAMPEASRQARPAFEERELKQRIVETVDRTVVEAVTRQLKLNSQAGRSLTGQMRSQLYQDLVLERERLGMS